MNARTHQPDASPPPALALLVPVLLVSCAEPLDVKLDVQVSDVIPTVVTVSWERVHDDADDVCVEYGRGPVMDQRWPARCDDQGLCRAVILGLKPNTSYRVRAAETEGDTRYVSDRWDAHTGPRPPEIPALSASTKPGRMPAGGFLVTSLLTDPSRAVIVDGDGEVVWWHHLEGDWDRMFIPRVYLAADGQHVLYQATASAQVDGEALLGQRVLARVSLDGTDVETVTVLGLHHDFVELPDGALATLTQDERAVDGKTVVGDRVVEVTFGGEPQEIWSVWDHFDYDPGQQYGEAGSGWTHANAIDHDPATDQYTVSLRNLDTLVRLDRDGDEVLWQLGGDGGDFALPPDQSPPFQRQHQFQMRGDSVLVFDNGAVESADSRAVEYALEPTAGEAHRLWAYAADPPLFSVAFGDVTRLPSGHTLITWSSQGQIDEITEDGAQVWQLSADLGAGFGYTTWHESLAE